jgi:hydrogenase nickel incorporation protein HypB
VKEVIPVQQRVLSKNEQLARNLADIFKSKKIFVLNMISSPGSGKTSLLEKLLPLLQPHVRCGVLEGDVQTENDAVRIARIGIPVRQIITCGTCHLDAQMVSEHLDGLPLDEMDVLFIENVGNLVCPSSYVLGEDDRLVLLSTAEGDDKPLKYPAAFRKATVLVINKIDLLGLSDFDLDRAVAHARGINPALEVFPVSCRTGEGLAALAAWIRERTRRKQGPQD